MYITNMKYLRNFIYTYIRMPIGTDQRVTDSITNIVEKRVIQAVQQDKEIVESVIGNVAKGASENPFDGGLQTSPHLGKVTVAFVKFEERHGKSTEKYLNVVRDVVADIRGAEISVNQENMGPPSGKPVNIEIAADDFGDMIVRNDKLNATPEGRVVVLLAQEIMAGEGAILPDELRDKNHEKLRSALVDDAGEYLGVLALLYQRTRFPRKQQFLEWLGGDVGELVINFPKGANNNIADSFDKITKLVLLC